MRKSWLVRAAVVLVSLWATPASAALTVEITSGYNLVVDSNITAPSTYGPKSAYIGAKICNTGAVQLDNVIAYAGDNKGGVADTPGIFPVTSFGADPLRPHLAGTGNYSFTLEAGATGAADGTRYIGTLAAGACRVQYWLFSYPQCVNVGGQPQSPPCDVSIAGTIQPEDDLSLDYDIWATSTTGAVTTLATRSFTMRNEISAAANKIWPNTTSKVPDEYLTAIQSVVGWGTLGADGQPLTALNPVYPGQRVITTQGIWYDLGNVGHGFDNNGDLIPDQNAWLQPVGDPGSFDADCFRMVNVYGIVIVKLKTGGELLIPFQNQLYYQSIPDNTGVVGLVYYQFIATDSGCSANMTPYQEAASGFDNEKFSADYGLSLNLSSGSFDPASELTFTKSDGVASVAPGGGLTYTVTANNVGTGVNLGAPDLGTPLTFRERIPAGATFVAGSADDSPAANLTEPTGTGSFSQGYTDAAGNLDLCAVNYSISSSSYVILYSANSGATWSLTEPAPATVTDIQWLLITTLALDGSHNGTDCVSPNGVYDNGTLETSLPVGKSASVALGVAVAANPDPVLCNTASLQFGPASSGIEAVDCDLVSGNNTLSGTVFQDNGAGGGSFGNGTKDGTEAGIGAGVVVELSYDANGDGRYGSGDLLYGSTTTAAAGAYSFSNIPDGPFVVALQKYDRPGAGNDVNDFVAGWGGTTYDPNLPLTTDQGVLKLNEDLNRATLAVNVDYLRDSGAQTVSNVNFGFAPPLRLTKGVLNNPDSNADGRADSPLDEGDVFSYVISLENRLPSVGRQGLSGCEYTVWARTGATGNSPKDFTNPGNAYDAATPNGTVASALINGGGLRWLYGSTFPLAPQLGNITKVEALYFAYFSTALSDDFLTLEDSFTANATGLTAPLKTGTLSTAMIDSYVGPRPDYDPNSAISWDISALRPGCTTCSVANWSWADFPALYLFVKADKASAADAKYFSLDAVGVRVTSDKDCAAGASTTLSPVPVQDSYDAGSFAFVSADPAPTSVDTATGVIQWNNVGPILPGTTRTVTVTLRALDVNGLLSGSCGASSPPAANSACNWAETAYGGKNVFYADGRQANDDSGKIAVAIQGKAELRGTVWNDANNSGWNIGGGETGMPGVVVTLYACMQSDGITLETATPNSSCVNTKNGGKNDLWVRTATTTTGADGAYEFIGLDTGTYIIEIGDTDGQPASGTGGNSAPFGKAQTAEPNDNQGVTTGNANAPAGGQVWNNTWGDVNHNLSAQNILTATSGTEETINGINFGYYSATAVIYGSVWHDTDGDASPEAGDGGLSGFTVRLFTDADGDGIVETGDTVVATAVSDGSGNYSFTGLAADDYVVVVTMPTLRSTAWTETIETTGGTGSLDNRIPVSVAAGAFSGSHDFGYTQLSSSDIGDTLYFDFDADGVQDANEAGIPNVTVWLYEDVDRDGAIDAGVDTLLTSDVTNTSGKYLFQDLPAGSYVVKVDTVDPDFPSGVTVTGDTDVDTGRIGNLVFLDANADGSAAGDDGIPNVLVVLYEDTNNDGALNVGADQVVAATTTDIGGGYLFTGLHSGAYFVDVADDANDVNGYTLPGAGFSLVGADPKDTLITLATNSSSVFTADAGYSPSTNYAVGNRVWSDADGDNVQDANEVGLPGIRVVVTNGTGTGCSPTCTATTDAAGFWAVTGLTNGTFTTNVTNADLPRNFTLTGGTAPRTVTVSGADLANVDFGYRFNTDGNPLTRDTGDPTGNIAGRVFNDADGDGVYDAGEALSGTTVDLLDDASTIIGTTATAADGTYSFGGMFIGNYAVRTVDQLGTRYSVSFLSAGETFQNLNVMYDNAVETIADSQSSVSVDGLHDDLMQDFGYQRFQGSIGDTVYHDVNENATQDFGEPGIAGVTVWLSLWKDAVIDGGNGDGIVAAAELTLLLTTATTADDPLTAADEGGKYLFSNLEEPTAGQYLLVRVDTATLPGTAALIADPDTDGDVCPLVAPLDPVCDSQQVVGGFSTGINYLGADFGYRITGSGNATVGDHLWIDADGDGSLDSGELGVRFITVWFDADNDGAVDWADGNANGVWDSGEGERWVETDSDGYYVFANVADGTYDLKVLFTDADWPAGLPTAPVYEARVGNTASLNNAVRIVVAGGAVTSIVDGDGATADACATCNLDSDFGYRRAGTNSLGGTVCVDDATKNGFCGATAVTYSGVAAGTESPLAGVQVTLYQWTDDGDNTAWTGATLDSGDVFTLFGSTTTGANGDYSFTGVPDNVVVVLGIPDAQNLRISTTSGNSSVEDAGVISRQLYEGTSTYQDNTVTVLARQALNLGPDADNAIVDLDYAFDSTLGGAVAFDFGDLPASTPDYNATLLADSGARHKVTGASIYLGAGVSTETDGKPSADAGADPLISGDMSDDGVVLVTPNWVIGAAGGAVDVTASAAGWVAGWIDFNQDGDFSDADEQVASQAVAAGVNLVDFDVPGSVSFGTNVFFARFRIYPAMPLFVSSTGLALDGSFQPAGGEVEDYQWNVNVTVAVVSSFRARAAGGTVTLEWETSSEIGTVGFFLYRWDEAQGQYLQVNATLLPSLLSGPQGGRYRFVDEGALPGLTYAYVLVEVEASGRLNSHGPYRVRASLPGVSGPAAAAGEASAPEGGYSRASKRSAAPQRTTASATARAAKPGTGTLRAKVALAERGLYFLSVQDLAEKAGLQVEKSWLSGKQYALANQGAPVAYSVARDASGVYFFGERQESVYTPDNIYLFERSPGDGVRMAARDESSKTLARGDELFPRTVRAEEDHLPVFTLASDSESDWWLWEYLIAGSGAKAFAFRTDGVGAGSSTLTLRLRGGTDTEANPDHHAVVTLNGYPVADALWNGTAAFETTVTFDAGLLSDGANVLEIDGLTDTQAPYSVFYLDSFDVSYPSRYRAHNNTLECSAAGNRAILMSGFTAPEILVFDVTDPRNPVAVQGKIYQVGPGDYGVNLAPRSPDAAYFAVTLDAVLPAGRVTADLPSDLRNPANRAEYLVVTTAGLQGAADRLAQHHDELTSQVVDLEDVYDEFGGGIASPHALRAFLDHAWRTWEQPPRYVVLAGDGTYDYRDHEGQGGNLIPPMMMATPFGIFPSDTWFANVETSTSAPEMAIGRLPVVTAAELDSLVDKIETRDGAGGAAWLNRVLLLSDNPDRSGDFPAGGDALARLAPPEFTTEHISLSEAGASASRTRMFAAAAEGTGAIGYVGHAGYDIFADERLLTSDDAPVFGSAGHPAVVTAMTCLAGHFALPGYPSISEVLVRQAGGGVAAVWSPSGLSQNGLAVSLADGFYRAFFGLEELTVGEAVLMAAEDYAAKGQPAYMLNIYNLLGDPAMRLR